MAEDAPGSLREMLTAESRTTVPEPVSAGVKAAQVSDRVVVADPVPVPAVTLSTMGSLYFRLLSAAAQGTDSGSSDG